MCVFCAPSCSLELVLSPRLLLSSLSRFRYPIDPGNGSGEGGGVGQHGHWDGKVGKWELVSGAWTIFKFGPFFMAFRGFSSRC